MTQKADGTYDAVLVGTGFSSTFFLHRYLRRAGSRARVLVLERGQLRTHAWQLDGGRAELERETQASFVNRTAKPWVFTNAFGGGSNCWNACTPRLLPDDFRLRTLCGVGADWPLSYDELEPYYCDAEDMMAIAGSSDDSPSPRSRPYPQPPHTFSSVDRAFKRAYPREVFVQPAARPSRPTANRPRCCANHTCTLCPIDSKFTIQNEYAPLYRDPRVTLELGAAVQSVEIAGGTTATGVTYLSGGAEHTARGNLVVLGANAIFNAHILLRSGLAHPELGRGLIEHPATSALVYLDGIDNFDGSTLIIGYAYMLHGRERRRERPAAVIELRNTPQLRDRRGKWRQLVGLNVIFEDLRAPSNTVTVSSGDPTKPETTFAGYSEYAKKGFASVEADLTRILAPLPVESLMMDPELFTYTAHISGTTVMGDNAASSVVDRHLVHHAVRNLVVLGSSTFPTIGTANPTLTISALALRAADHVGGTGAPT